MATGKAGPLQQSMADADMGLRGRDGHAMHVTPHGHVSTEMTLRYAALAAPAVRTVYEEAISKARASSAGRGSHQLDIR